MEEDKAAYNSPNPTSKDSAIFCQTETLIFHTTTIGSVVQIKSDIIDQAALVNTRWIGDMVGCLCTLPPCMLDRTVPET